MKVKVEVEDELLEAAARVTGIGEPRELVARGLELLVAGDSATRFALLRGTPSPAERRRRRQ